MGITHELAQPIVSHLGEVLDCPISITDSKGIIVASSDSKRLNTRHEAALEAIANRSELKVSEEMALDYSNTLEGITLPLILHKSCVGALCLKGRPEELNAHASIISIAVTSLLETAEITHRASTRQNMMDAWVKDLTNSSDEDYEQIVVQAGILGIDCQKPSALVVVRFNPVAQVELPALKTTIAEVAHAGPGLQFLSYTGQGHFVCALPVADFGGETELHEACGLLVQRLACFKLRFHIGVGRRGSGIQGYRQSYHDALHGVRVAERLGDAKHVLYYNEQRIFRLLEGVPDYLREVFIDTQAEDRNWDPVLLETLQTYFAMDRRINETARALYIHRNTLLFRLNKIADTYRLDPRKFHDAVVLQTLLYLIRLSLDTAES
ncbi:MAG: helix-turn-helix domain-containing protein [Coriobacteriales bacterium]|jgi:carbohydrate diacid regulator|nr:helix-turn-helix domain-containing protein [Coriobacteriales bacterium]